MTWQTTTEGIRRTAVPGGWIYLIDDVEAGLLQPVFVPDRTAKLQAMRELYEGLEGRVAVLEG
ncbi:hypothetical protein LCGC14_1370010, partial [marine sediment metagenome]